MLDNHVVRVKVTGEFACFTRPDLKVERMTYPSMTPSAARGILDSILWKPEFKWYVRKILVLNPVTFFSIKRNEINSKQGKTPLVIEDKRAQRNSIVLKDVAYIIEASVCLDEVTGKDTLYYVPLWNKYSGMFERRVKKGQCYRRPFLGTREFAAEFSPLDGTEQPISDTIPIGSMLFDIFYDEAGRPSPVFFYDVAIKEGILNCDVPENETMMRSTHLQPTLNGAVSTAIYDFTQAEEGQ